MRDFLNVTMLNNGNFVSENFIKSQRKLGASGGSYYLYSLELTLSLAEEFYKQ